MADDRPVDDPTSAIVALQKQLDDLTTTMNARVAVQPTGDIQPTLRSTPKAGTLFLDGSTVSRTTYAVLWQWVQDQGLVISGLFTSGDGSTTFGLPNFQGRVVVGVGTLSAISYALGATGGSAAITLTAANLANHTHTATTNGSGNHGHSYSTDGSGSHGGHFPDSGPHLCASGSAIGAAAWNAGGTTDGFHSHTGGTTNVADHTHTLTTSGTGTTTTVDPRQPYIAVNWAIWT